MSLAIAALCLAGVANASAGLYDKPTKVVHLPLPADPLNPQAKPQLSCFYYPHFMVKQVDLGEAGAEELSILPVAAGTAKPACKRENAAEEKVVSPTDWSGYFEGVSGSYVIFSADDGWNDGMGFAVFTPDAKKIFEDVAKKWHSIQTTPSGIAMRYERVYGASCSLQADKASCWLKIEGDTGLKGTPPDCRAAYDLEAKRTPSADVVNDPTVVDYEVAVVLAGAAPTSTPVTGKAIGCRPSI